VFVSVVLAVLWQVCIFAPWNWQSSVGLLVNFYANMLKMELTQGTAPKILSGLSNLASPKNKLSQELHDLLDKPMWMGEGTNELCQPHFNIILNWCNTWQMVKFGSWFMMGAGVSASLFLFLGACFLWYYANVHATHTGRMGAKLSFVLAPVLAVVGLVQYVILTLDFGLMPASFMPQMPQRMFDVGFFVCCTLCLLTWLPLAMQAIFSKTNPGEKPRSNDDEDLYLNNPAAYNTFPESGMQNPMQQGWAPAGPPGQAYGSAPMPQRVDSAHGGPPASGMGGPAPGMGGAAW